MTSQNTEMTLDECWSRLEEESVGRLAMCMTTGVGIFPIDFTVHDDYLYVRTAPGANLMELAKRSVVAFEIDGRRVGTHWNVVVKGEAQGLESDDEIAASGVLRLRTEAPGTKWNYLRISPETVTGRRFSLLEELSEPISSGPSALVDATVPS